MSMHAKPGLMSLDDALAALTSTAAPHRVEATQTVSSFDALGRVLANDLVSPLDVPPADNTSMDGYAVRAADAQDAARPLPVSQRIPAGRPPTPLQTGTAARIFTGAFIPEGADAVVMQEVCQAVSVDNVDGKGVGDGDGVRILQAPKPGQWIRRRGEDVRRGDVVLTGGTLLTPQALGQAAGVGASQIEVRRHVRVALMSTGDELVMPGAVAPADMPLGAIYNSNRYTLHGLLRAAGCEVSDLGIVPDDRAATERALRDAASAHDLIVSSGGVSVGEEDHIRPALAVVGHVQLWQLSIKPGKPLAFGAVRREGSSSMSGQALFLGLPGNPVSSFVTFLLAALPVIRTLQGATRAVPRAVPMRADFEWTRPDTKRREFIRVRRNDGGGLEVFPNQSSGVLTSTVWADGLADLEPGQVVKPGDAIPFLPWAAFGL
jgi:molybdopterin molybdotransferase